MKPAVIDNWSNRKFLFEGPPKYADSPLAWHPGWGIDFHSFYSRTRGPAFENKSAKFLFLKLFESFLCPYEHAFRMINSRADSYKSRGIRITNQMNRFSW